MFNVKKRTSFVAFGVLIFLLVYFTYSGVKSKKEKFHESFAHDVQLIEKMMGGIKNRVFYLLSLRAEFIADMPEVKKAMAVKDRQALINSVSVEFDRFDKEFNGVWKSLHFIDAAGNSLYRAHMPEKYGDNLLELRALVREGIEKKRKVAGIELGKSMVSQRILAPVFYEKKFVGLVDTGLSLQFLAKRLSMIGNIKTAIIIKKGQNVNFANTSESEDYLVYNNSPEIFLKLLKDKKLEDISEDEKIDGRKFRIIKSFNVKDTFGIEIASLLFVKDISEEYKWYLEYIIKSSAIAFFVFIFLYIVIRNGFINLVGELEESYTVLKEDLVKSEEKYKNYVDNAPIGIFIADKNGQYLDVNVAACKITGFSRDELLEMKIPDLWSDESYETGSIAFNELQEYGKSSSTIRLRHKDKKHKGTFARVDSVELKDGIYIGFAQDITQIIEYEKRLQNLNSELSLKVQAEIEKRRKQEHMLQEQKKFADMGQMVSAIAHQWRQPLNALGLHVQDIRDSFEFDELDYDRIVNFEKSSLDLIAHMSSTVDYFRQFFSPDKEKRSFDIISAINEILKLIRVQLSNREIDVEIIFDNNGKTVAAKGSELPAEMTGRLFANAFQGEFKQAVINLIYNSVDSIVDKLKDGIIEKGRLQIFVKYKKGKAELEFCDNGKGIPREISHRVFDPYFTTKEEGKGTGIGLYMARIVFEQQMGGRIALKTNNSEGCVFLIELPATEKPT